MIRLLIDADMLLFKAVKSCEVEIEWMPDIITTHLPLREVSLLFDDLSKKLKDSKTVSGFAASLTKYFIPRSSVRYLGT